MENLYDTLVFIGRFQPFHQGHLSVIRAALKKTRMLIVLVGSANLARSPRNPFTFDERADQIGRVLDDIGERARVSILPIADAPYNDAEWIARVQKAVGQATKPGDRIGLVGHSKDHSSYYLKLFPTWGAVDVAERHAMINATQIREDYLRPAARLPGAHVCPETVIHFLEQFTLTEAFAWLVEEARFYADYRARWANAPYPPFIACVDAVVVQSGHILLVERAHAPGKGLLALPGGHVNPKESFRAAAIRELKEETRINDGKGEIPPAMLSSFIEDSKTRLFDDPHRSERGRVVTQAYLFSIPARKALFEVRGDDDAAAARWFPLGSLKASDLFEDHAAIIEEMTGAALD